MTKTKSAERQKWNVKSIHSKGDGVLPRCWEFMSRERIILTTHDFLNHFDMVCKIIPFWSSNLARMGAAAGAAAGGPNRMMDDGCNCEWIKKPAVWCPKRQVEWRPRHIHQPGESEDLIDPEITGFTCTVSVIYVCSIYFCFNVCFYYVFTIVIYCDHDCFWFSLVLLLVLLLLYMGYQQDLWRQAQGGGSPMGAMAGPLDETNAVPFFVLTKQCLGSSPGLGANRGSGQIVRSPQKSQKCWTNYHELSWMLTILI